MDGILPAHLDCSVNESRTGRGRRINLRSQFGGAAEHRP